MHDPFDRRISFGVTDLVKGRVKKDGIAYKKIKEFLDPLIRSNNLFKDMPFLWIGIDFRCGIKNDLKVEYSRINKKYGDLCIAVELDMEILEWADRHNLDLLHDIFMIAALEALIQVGRKYEFPVNLFEEERRKYGSIPSTLEECETYVRPSILG